MRVNGNDYLFSTTYDGDSQYHVEVRSGEHVIAAFKIAAASERDVFEAAAAHFSAGREMGNTNGHG